MCKVKTEAKIFSSAFLSKKILWNYFYNNLLTFFCKSYSIYIEIGKTHPNCCTTRTGQSVGRERLEGASKVRNGPANLTSGSRAHIILLLAKQINCLKRVSTPFISRNPSLRELLTRRTVRRLAKSVQMSPNPNQPLSYEFLSNSSS